MNTRGRKPSVTRSRIGDRWVNIEHYKKNLEPTDSGCIEWTGSKNNAGYGFIGFKYDPLSEKRVGMMTVHRLALMIKLGREIQPGMNANHTCHNRLCCNPDHLVEGTQQEKIQEMTRAGIVRGRRPGSTQYSEKQGNRSYKYTDEYIQWYRTASLDEIMAQTHCTREDASKRRSMFRKGYTWLAAPVAKYKNDRPGPKKKVDQ